MEHVSLLWEEKLSLPIYTKKVAQIDKNCLFSLRQKDSDV